MKIKLLFTAIAITISFMIGLTLTLGTNAIAAGNSPCADDIAKFCKDVKPGKGTIADCLDQHEKELTMACQDLQARMGGNSIEKRAQKKEEVMFRNACRNDIAQFCADVKPGKAALMQCLDQNENELAPPCAKMVRIIKQQKN